MGSSSKPRQKRHIERYLDTVLKQNGGWKSITRVMAEIAHNSNHPKQLEAAKDLLDRRFGKPAQAISIDPAANKITLELVTVDKVAKKKQSG